MSFGQALGAPTRHAAHASRDRGADGERGKRPSVPRAPRAVPRANSCGALSRSQRSSEERRPREASPFTYARVNLLHREVEAPQNQGFEMGPFPRSISSAERPNHRRSHALAHDSDANGGVPLGNLPVETSDRPEPGRRNTLQHERLAADQGLEWVPSSSQPSGTEKLARDHSRVNVLAREDAAIDGPPSGLAQSAASQGAQAAAYHGRRNVLTREQHSEASEIPRFSGYEAGSGVPVYSRKSLLAKECGPRTAKAH